MTKEYMQRKIIGLALFIIAFISSYVNGGMTLSDILLMLASMYALCTKSRFVYDNGEFDEES